MNEDNLAWENSHEKAQTNTASMGEAADNMIDIYLSDGDMIRAVDVLGLYDQVQSKARELCHARLIRLGLLKT